MGNSSIKIQEIQNNINKIITSDLSLKAKNCKINRNFAEKDDYKNNKLKIKRERQTQREHEHSLLLKSRFSGQPFTNIEEMNLLSCFTPVSFIYLFINE